MSETPDTHDDERSLGTLVKEVAEHSTRMARMELELAEAEVTLKARRAGLGVGMLGVAAILGLFALAAVTAGAIMVLALAIPAWLSALIIGALYGGGAALVALIGTLKVRQATPPEPEQAVESVKQDLDTVKTRIRSAQQ